MAARFFVDENDLALGKALAERRGGVVFPGHPDLPEVPRQSLDDDWLGVIGAEGLVVITRDQRIRYRPVEEVWVHHRVRGFVLTGRTSQSTDDSLDLLENHWAAMEVVVESDPEALGCTPSLEPGYERSTWLSGIPRDKPVIGPALHGVDQCREPVHDGRRVMRW